MDIFLGIYLGPSIFIWPSVFTFWLSEVIRLSLCCPQYVGR